MTSQPQLQAPFCDEPAAMKKAKKKERKDEAAIEGKEKEAESHFLPDPSDPTKPYNYTRTYGLGTLDIFEDWLIMRILSYLAPVDLCELSLVSRAFYIYSDEEDLWKDLCIRRHGGNFSFKGTWKRTVLLPREKPVDRPYQKLNIPGFYSNYLYRRWYRGHVPISHFSELPADLPEDRKVERRSGLSRQEFITEYAMKNKPVILTDVVTKWRAWKEQSWTKEALSKRVGHKLFRVDQTDQNGDKLYMTLNDYWAYAATNHDEDPIYVFCPVFGERVPELLEDYEVPEYFAEDLFSLMEDERPFYRWIVIGGERSGSPFHLDPFKTSAWNALLYGRKRWALYPPGIIPPGVDESEDEDGEPDYTGEDPVVWYLEHYPQVKNRSDVYRPIECILEAGEIIYVPTNWWHTVFNITETVAVTQNFCDSWNFVDVYRDLGKDKEFKKGHYLFTERLLASRPDLMKKVELTKRYWKRKAKVMSKMEKKREIVREEIEEAIPADKMDETSRQAMNEFNKWSFWRSTPLPLYEVLSDDELSLDVLDESSSSSSSTSSSASSSSSGSPVPRLHLDSVSAKKKATTTSDGEEGGEEVTDLKH